MTFISQRRWYQMVGLVCVFTFLFMVYRREARMRAKIESLEAQVTEIQRYLEEAETRRGDLTIAQTEAGLPATTERKAKPGEANKVKAEKTRKTPATYSSEPKTTDKAPAEAKEERVAEPADNPTGKFRQVVRIELNTADSATLVRIPGIGEGTARAILQYRTRLGGFYSAEQIREKLTWDNVLPRLDEWCEKWFWVDENLVQKLQINQLSFKELLRHPYLNYEDVKKIVKWRERHGAVHKVADLEQMGIADSIGLERLLHYVEF